MDIIPQQQGQCPCKLLEEGARGVHEQGNLITAVCYLDPELKPATGHRKEVT